MRQNLWGIRAWFSNRGTDTFLVLKKGERKGASEEGSKYIPLDLEKRGETLLGFQNGGWQGDF